MVAISISYFQWGALSILAPKIFFSCLTYGNGLLLERRRGIAILEMS